MQHLFLRLLVILTIFSPIKTIYANTEKETGFFEQYNTIATGVALTVGAGAVFVASRGRAVQAIRRFFKPAWKTELEKVQEELAAFRKKTHDFQGTTAESLKNLQKGQSTHQVTIQSLQKQTKEIAQEAHLIKQDTTKLNKTTERIEEVTIANQKNLKALETRAQDIQRIVKKTDANVEELTTLVARVVNTLNANKPYILNILSNLPGFKTVPKIKEPKE